MKFKLNNVEETFSIKFIENSSFVSSELIEYNVADFAKGSCLFAVFMAVVLLILINALKFALIIFLCKSEIGTVNDDVENAPAQSIGNFLTK
jgi:hypothetical protein